MRLLITLIAAIICFVANAQKTYILHEGNNNFIEHKVVAGQNTYGIARAYGTTEDEVDALNGLKKDAIISIGQILRIPVTKKNFVTESQDYNEFPLQPLYYTVKKADNLYRLGINFNTKADVIQKINNKPNNIIGEGQEIIVGYMRVLTLSEEVPVKGIKTLPQQTETKNEEPVNNKQDERNDAKEPVKKPVATEKPEEKKQEEPYKQHKIEPVQEPQYTGVYDAGFFATQFPEKGNASARKKLSVKAGTFKTTSGWADKKYYVLINDVPQSTIVRIESNGRVIYAKVLNALPEMKENKNISLRLSAAAASSLGQVDNSFDVEVTYYTN